jgi:segregation and condensation protein B
VLKTLLDRKLIATAGRKDVVGRPITYKTTKEFLIQFGLSSLKELPTLKEFEELGRLALADELAEPEQATGERQQDPHSFTYSGNTPLEAGGDDNNTASSESESAGQEAGPPAGERVETGSDG